jgi:hypothetical protein
MPLGTRAPDRAIMVIDGLSVADAKWLSSIAVIYARRHAPKLTGISASRIMPLYGREHFGLRWADDRVWFQNAGVNPFVMRSLAGKTIPMWIDDPTGTERQKNPNAKVRVTESQKIQVLIFRRVGRRGDKKTVTRRTGGQVQKIEVPNWNFPGAPGRITMREAAQPHTTPGRVGGRIAKGNIGLRWYFPGLSPRNFIQHGLVQACNAANVIPGPIHIGYNFYSARASLGDKIPAYPRQPMAERMSKMAKRGMQST